MKLKRIICIEHHRNGIDGAPFHAILFTDQSEDGSRKLGVVFAEQAHVAVLDVAKLAAGDIAFGSNSWRGDRYECALRQVIVQANNQRPPSTQDRHHVEHGQRAERKSAAKRSITIVWNTEDVQEVRPDLTDDQAWHVLQTVELRLNSEFGINWDFIRDTADELYPDPDDGNK